MTKSMNSKTIPTAIHINGQKIHGGMIQIKYAKKDAIHGGIIPNQTFQHGTPYVGYTPNIESDIYGKNGVNGFGMFDFIPVIGPLISKITGIGLEEEGGEINGGFPFLSVIPAVLSGIDLISNLFKGKGLTKESQICEMPGEECKIDFKDSNGNGLFQTKEKLNGMHKALLLDQKFLHDLHGKGHSFPGGRGISFGRNINGTDLERSKEGEEEINALIGLTSGNGITRATQELNGLVGLSGSGFGNMKNINLA